MCVLLDTIDAESFEPISAIEVQKGKISRISETLAKHFPKTTATISAASATLEQSGSSYFEFNFQNFFKGNTKNAALKLLVYDDLCIGSTIINCLLDTHLQNSDSNNSIFGNISRTEESEDSLKIDPVII